MSYESRIESVRVLIEEHNKSLNQTSTTLPLPQLSQSLIDFNQFISCVKTMGGTSEEGLSSFSHEDILDCLPFMDANLNGLVHQVKPKILAKQIATIFRSKHEVKEEGRPISAKKVDKMTLRELIENFDSEDYSGPIGKRLSDVAKKEPFIVFSSNRNIDVETTLKLLLEIKQGYPGRVDVDVNGITKKAYKLGELPENYAEENPIYRDRPLRPDGTCDQTGRSWEGVPLETRQLIRVAMDTGELQISHEMAHFILDMVMNSNAKENLSKRYRKAAVLFNELQSLGKLPLLKIILGKSKANDLYANGQKVVWDVNPKTQGYSVYSNDARILFGHK